MTVIHTVLICIDLQVMEFPLFPLPIYLPWLSSLKTTSKMEGHAALCDVMTTTYKYQRTLPQIKGKNSLFKPMRSSFYVLGKAVHIGIQGACLPFRGRLKSGPCARKAQSVCSPFLGRRRGTSHTYYQYPAQ